MRTAGTRRTKSASKSMGFPEANLHTCDGLLIRPKIRTVHEAAHLLHYLKPEHYGLRVRRGQERFVDVEFRQRQLFAFACEAYSHVVVQRDRNRDRVRGKDARGSFFLPA